ncbi:E3 ubiquitin-protein ligase ubr3 [Takifugu flavidus]|uniref:E3 ubiquitin-protein ligase n=1 Tax=Takifugu flavidus TaxID=433684 RepID=A0A5C6PN10_9TELE|nr:E3 ubiquitin-protein ligase ubr3 [Takifugu flavidus]
MDLGASEVMESEVLYDCVICGQSGPSTEERPFGLVVLLQASSVLGHRCRSKEAKKLPTSDEEHIFAADTCGVANDIRLTLMQRFFKDTESNLSKEMELVIKDIKNTTQKKYMDYGKNPGSPDNDFLFMYSVASSFDEERPEVPMLFRDVPSLLIIFVLTMPQPLRKEHFTCVVKMLYNLQFIQALAALSSKFSPDERQAWSTAGVLKKNSSLSEKSFEVLLSLVISELSKDKSVYKVDSKESSMLISSVWSPQSIEFSLQQFCLPFLRLSCLLQHHLYGDNLTGCQEEDEFAALAACLGLFTSVPQPSSMVNSASCLQWPVNATDLVTQWCTEVTALSQIQAEQSLDPQWAPPRLLQPPDNYNIIFQYYHRKACTACKKVPKDPALCLVCGAFVCLKGACCKQQGTCECVLHSQHCGAATGIFLLINASVIIIIRGHRFCLWGSVYLDAHGEEDRDLRRGKPLFLCEERYRVLEQQWVSHTFDHINKRWGPHYNGL